jgi:hypothetical protein
MTKLQKKNGKENLQQQMNHKDSATFAVASLNNPPENKDFSGDLKSIAILITTTSRSRTAPIIAVIIFS